MPVKACSRDWVAQNWQESDYTGDQVNVGHEHQKLKSVDILFYFPLDDVKWYASFGEGHVVLMSLISRKTQSPIQYSSARV